MVKRLKLNGVAKWGAIAGMVVGSGTTLLWKLTGLSEKVIYELVPEFILALIAVEVVSLLTRRTNVSKR